MKYRILSDVHGHSKVVRDAYNSLPENTTLIQIGDLGFSDTYLALKDLDPDRFKVVAGNHDDYDAIDRYPWYLGNSGILPGNQSIMFCRGAWSIDRAYRTPGFDWWAREELNIVEAEEFLELYEKTKPDIMISHTCPANIALTLCQEGQSLLSGYHGSFTEEFLYQAWKIHEPKIWYFGHWHSDWVKQVGNTKFRCLAINQYIDVEF